MKKLFIAAFAVLSFGANAQDFKPTTGEITAEFGVTGGIMSTSFNLADQGFGSGPMFKGRYFKTEKMAYRGTLFLANNSTTTNPSSSVQNTVSNFGFLVGFGLEKHFKGTDRLSPYVGADALIGFKSNSNKSVNSSTNFTTETTSGDFRIGLRGVFGAVYYFTKKVYVGVEAGLGMFYVSDSDTKITSTGSPDVTAKGGSNFAINPELVTGVRFGFVF